MTHSTPNKVNIKYHKILILIQRKRMWSVKSFLSLQRHIYSTKSILSFLIRSQNTPPSCFPCKEPTFITTQEFQATFHRKCPPSLPHNFLSFMSNQNNLSCLSLFIDFPWSPNRNTSTLSNFHSWHYLQKQGLPPFRYFLRTTRLTLSDIF